MSVSSSADIKKLHQLAKLKGLQIQYESTFGTKPIASSQAIVAILRSLGTSIKDDLSDLDRALEKALEEVFLQLTEPVIVVWEGSKAINLPIRTPVTLKKATLRCELRVENGKPIKKSINLSRLPVRRRFRSERGEFIERIVRLDQQVAPGYHDLVLSIGGKQHRSLIVAAPQKAYRDPSLKASDRLTGVFSPLYALRSKRSWGVGDFRDFDRFIRWAYEAGCDFVGTLPLFAGFMDQPLEEPSPYSPASRLFWNEVFVDPRLSEEWLTSEKAQALADSKAFQDEVKKQQGLPLVDYRGVARLKRQIGEILAAEFFDNGGDKKKEFKAFLREKPLVEDYAEFRAACEKTGKLWPEWPDRMRDGKLQASDYDEKDRRFHLYSQWLAHQQLSALSLRSRAGGTGVYLDFPLSVHAGGFDVWKERQSFGKGASAGCPPDTNHTNGQDWGILPLHPTNSRKTGYRYFRACITSQMTYCGLLRLDHVMSLYRLYWVPQGLGAKDGVYVYYNYEDLFAILTLESHRNKCMLIGEDLGTVPPEIRTNMQKHEIMRMHVQQRALKDNPKEPVTVEPPNSIASMNTHDMPPFAAFWQYLDIKDKVDLGLLTEEQVQEKIKSRQKLQQLYVKYLQDEGFLTKPVQGVGQSESDLRAIMEAAHQRLAAGGARAIIVNAEDLWLETNPQNIPATWKERPNWRRKLRYGLEDIEADQACFDRLRRIVIERKAGSRP